MTLNLKTENQSPCMALWPMMLHHHNKFGYRWFSSSGDAVQVNIHWNFEHFCDLDLDHNRAIQPFHNTIQLMMTCHQTKSSCKRISSSEDVLESHIFILWSFTVTLILKTANQSFWKTICPMVNNFFCMILHLMMIHHHTKFD